MTTTPTEEGTVAREANTTEDQRGDRVVVDEKAENEREDIIDRTGDAPIRPDRNMAESESVAPVSPVEHQAEPIDVSRAPGVAEVEIIDDPIGGDAFLDDAPADAGPGSGQPGLAEELFTGGSEPGSGAPVIDTDLTYDDSLRDGAESVGVSEPTLGADLDPDNYTGPEVAGPAEALSDGARLITTLKTEDGQTLAVYNNRAVLYTDQSGKSQWYTDPDEDGVWVGHGGEQDGQPVPESLFEDIFGTSIGAVLESIAADIIDFFFGEGDEDAGPESDPVPPPAEIDPDDPNFQAQQAGRDGDIDYGDQHGQFVSDTELEYDGVDYGGEFQTPAVDERQLLAEASLDPHEDPAVDPVE